MATAVVISVVPENKQQIHSTLQIKSIFSELQSWQSDKFHLSRKNVRFYLDSS